MTTHYRVCICAIVICVAALVPDRVRSGIGDSDFNARVLDRLLPLTVDSDTYFLKLIMRYSDSASQIAVLVYPGGKAEIIESRVVDMPNGELSRQIAKILQERPGITLQQVADRFVVRVDRWPIAYVELSPVLKKLEGLRISPILTNRGGVDEVSKYEYWFDTGQESVHYSLIGPPQKAAQDSLAKWMIDFRAHLGELVKRPPPLPH